MKKSNSNEFLQGKGFYISYNSCPWAGFQFFESDNRSSETALVKEGKNKKFYILNGDFRKEYEQLIDKGFNACKTFYKKNIDHKSSWSN
ncbi:MAG: hypothetical protein ACP5N7_00465 [Candidatus Pacearchaeota archaeon]